MISRLRITREGHVTTVFQAILQDASGTFVLTDESVDEALTVPGLGAEGLLMEGVRRLRAPEA